jgi:RNA 2',3'-cyclic 3'-phosphodiesterase
MRTEPHRQIKEAQMSVIRAFIAIDLTPEITKQLSQISAQLIKPLEDIPVRWVPAGNIHLTLKFLGDVSIAHMEVLKEVLQGEASTHRSFTFSVGNLGAFPNIRHPRVIWVGVEAPNDLAALQRSIESSMARIGYAPEDRPFSPHLTLGRVSRNATTRDTHLIGEVLEASKVGFLGVNPVNSVCLYRSDLKPTGAEYTRIFSADLKAKDNH